MLDEDDDHHDEEKEKKEEDGDHDDDDEIQGYILSMEGRDESNRQARAGSRASKHARAVQKQKTGISSFHLDIHPIEWLSRSQKRALN